MPDACVRISGACARMPDAYYRMPNYSGTKKLRSNKYPGVF
jgi:hypothetical protein